MFREVCNLVCHNKNILMLFCAGIYILSLSSVLTEHTYLAGMILLLFCIICIIKNLFPYKLILLWILIFSFGIFNINSRIKGTDKLLSIAPVNSTIYGQILSIPETKDSNKTKFFFKVDKIEYNGLVNFYDNEKVLVTLDTSEKLNIYDFYKIRGRLSVPFQSGNPSQFDYSNYLRNFDTYAVFYGHNPYEMRDSEVPCYEKIDNKTPTKIQRGMQLINSGRDRIMNVHSKYIKSPYLEILGGIVFGDDAVSPSIEIKQSFINSGLLHILAASGMNVAFIFSFFFFILNLFKVNYKVNLSICSLAVITYVLMTGFGASVIRAGLMLLFVLFGKMIDRDAHSVSLLSFVAFLMLLYNPMYINDVGFQLSFIVTFGLLVTTPLLLKSKNRFCNWFIGTVSVPIIAQLWVIPIQIFYFNNISIYSVFANIMSVPILYVISFCGFISSLLALMQPMAYSLCFLLDSLLSPLLQILVSISDFWGNLPNAVHQTTHPSVVQVLVYYGIILCFLGILNSEITKNTKKVLKIFIIIFISILLISQIPIKNSNLEITAFNVGNADAFLIKTPDNKYIMVDTGKNGYNGGKSQAEMLIIKYFTDKGIKNLDSIIVTHFDNDHCGGAIDFLQKTNVDKIYVNSITHDSKSAKEIYLKAKERNTQVIEAKNGQIVYEKDGLNLSNYITKDIPGIGDNESSIVTLLSYHNFTMLFMADAGIETFYNLKNYIPRNITVLKVGHHGASGVVNKSMTDYLNPKFSIISTGENKFGHPSIYTISTLKNSNILRTDINNAIKIAVNNRNFTIYTYNREKRKFIKSKY